MGTFIYFTDEQKLRANSVDLEEFLRRRGETLLRSGRDMRLASDHSVTVRGSEWYDHADQCGGGPVSFVQKFCSLSFPEAMSLLLDGEPGQGYPPAREKEAEPPKPFTLPPKHGDMRRVYAYLVKHRHIDREVVSSFARAGLLYEDAEYHNAVFVGLDEHGVAHHAHKRSTNSMGDAFRINVEGSLPQYSFHHTGSGDRLYVFEAPIDMLSFITLYPKEWQEHSYVSLCGVGGQAMWWMLEQQPQLTKVALCLDNDRAGQQAAARLTAGLREKGYDTCTLLPERKDWNDVLVSEHSYAERPAFAMTME